MEVLIEDLMNLHFSSPSFRQIFESQQTTRVFVEGYKSFVRKVQALQGGLNNRTVRILEKLGHFGLALALDNCVAGGEKREVSNALDFVKRVLTFSDCSYRSWIHCNKRRIA
jgi:hypothetical protein